MVPIGDKHFTEGTKELYDSGKTPALRHIVKSAQRYGTRSKIHKTPEASLSNSEEERNKLNPYRLTYGELSEEDESDNFVYLELTEGDGDIEILRPGTSKSNVTQTKDNTVQTQDPEVNKKEQKSQNSWNKQETGDPEEVRRDRERNSKQESDKESEPESGQESEQESEPKLNEPLSEEESIPSSESDNDGDMAQPPAPPAVERGPSIRLPCFTGKEGEQVEKYFRELKRLKAIYKWQDDHLLNMSLLGLKGRADDWASALDSFAKLEEAIFGDKRAQWQKHADFSNLKQLKEQSVIGFAGVQKQKEAKSEATPAMMLAVFLDGLEAALGRQVAIMDPKMFEEAVASATRLETLEKTRATGKIMGATAEVKEESKQSDPVSEFVDRFGMVVARLESMPQQNKNPGTSGSRYNQRGQDKSMQQYQNKNYQSRPNTGGPAAPAGGEGKGQELSAKETGETPKIKEGYSYKGNNYLRWEYDINMQILHGAPKGRPFNRIVRVAEGQTKGDSSSRENLLWEKGAGKLVNRSERNIELCRVV